MFRKDQYIITLVLKDYDHKSDCCAKENYCFKMSRDEEYMVPQVDLEGDDNGHSPLKFDKSRKLVDWRYATPEEAEEYERLGKPYDVTTLPEFKVPEKWFLIITKQKEDEILTDYCNRIYKTETNPVSNAITQPIFYYSEQIAGICWNVGHNRADESFIEITYDQFLKYILKQNEVKEDHSYLITMIEKLND